MWISSNIFPLFGYFLIFFRSQLGQWVGHELYILGRKLPTSIKSSDSIHYKVLCFFRMETYNMQGAKNSSHNTTFEDDVLKELLGLSVITKYNNRTVRIDDVDFQKNPMSTFEKNGKQVNRFH